jgi:hypothetical protein
MSKFISDFVVADDAFELFTQSAEVAVSNFGEVSSDYYNQKQVELAALLSKVAKPGGIGTGDFYMSEDWYGRMTFGVILNTGSLLAEAALLKVAGWSDSAGDSCVVYYSGCGLSVSPQLNVAIWKGQVRINWRGLDKKKCLKRLLSNKLGI